MRTHLGRFSFVVCTLSIALAGCAKTEAPGADSTAMAAPMPEPAPAAPAISLSDMAGAWNMRSIPETGDKTPTTYTLTTAATTEGWTMKLPGRPAMPVRVTVSGDSVLTDAGPYESVRRKGVQVRTDGVLWHRGDSLIGKTIAHYSVPGADSVLNLRSSGTRSK